MNSIRNGIKYILKAVTVFATLLTMSYALEGSASAVVIGPLGNSTVVQAPIGSAVNPVGVQPAIVNPPVASQALVRPAASDLFFRPAFNPFFRPAFNPFFRPAFNPFFNPFFGVDVDLPFAGVGIGAVD